MTEEMGLQTFSKNRHRRRRRVVLLQSVPQSGSSDQGSFRGVRVGTPFPLLKCLRLHCWRTSYAGCSRW